MKSYFDILPTELMHVVISEWISTPDLAHLDTAVCNHSDRVVFLEVIDKSYFSTEGVEGKSLTNAYFQWLVLRNIQVRSLNLTFEHLDHFLFIMQLGHYITKVERLHANFQTDNISTCSLAILNKCFDRIESLDLSNPTRPVTDIDLWTIMKHIPSFPALKHVNLSGSMQMSHMALDQFLSKCPNLQRISLANMNKLQDSSVRSLLQHCPLLQEVDLSNCMSLSDETLQAMTEFTPRLHTLHLTNGTNYTASALQTLFQVPSLAQNLKTVVLEGCVAVNDAVLLAIADKVQCLQSLSLNTCPFITQVGVEKISYGCLYLHTLCLNDCSLLGKDQVLDMLRYCQQLQRVQATHCEIDYHRTQSVV